MNSSKFIKFKTFDPSKYGDIPLDYSLADQEYEAIIKFIKQLDEEHKYQLIHILYHIFVHFYLDLIIDDKNEDAQKFWYKHSSLFLESTGYEDTLRELKTLHNVEDVINHSTFYLYRSDKYVIELSKECKELLLQYLNNSNLLWTLRIIDIFFFVQDNDVDETVFQNEEKEKSINLKDIIQEVNKLSLPLPSVAVYSLDGRDMKKTNCVDLSHNKLMVAHGDENSAVCLWESNLTESDKDFCKYEMNKGPTTVFYGHSGEVNNVTFHPLDTLLFSCSSDNTVRAWTLNDNNAVPTIYKGQNGNIWDMDFNSDGLNFISACSDGSVYLFNITCTNPIREFKTCEFGVNCVKFNSDGDYFSTGMKDKTILWNVNSKTKISYFSHPGNVYSLVFSPYQNYLASSGEGNQIRIWDLRNPSTPLKKLHCYSDVICSLSFNGNGRVLAACGSGVIYFYDLNASETSDNISSEKLYCNVNNSSSFIGSLHIPDSRVQLVRFDQCRTYLCSTISIFNKQLI